MRRRQDFLKEEPIQCSNAREKGDTSLGCYPKTQKKKMIIVESVIYLLFLTLESNAFKITISVRHVWFRNVLKS